MKLGRTTTVDESETRSFKALIHVTMDSTCKSKRKDTTLSNSGNKLFLSEIQNEEFKTPLQSPHVSVIGIGS